MLPSSIKNKQYGLAPLVAWPGGNPDGSLNAGAFTPGASSNGSLTSINGKTGIRIAGKGYNRLLANKNNGPGDTVYTNQTLTVDRKKTYTLEFKSKTVGRRKGVLVWLEVRRADGKWRSNYYSAHITSHIAGKETKHIMVIAFPEFMEIDTIKFGFGNHFECDDPANPNSHIDLYDFFLRDHSDAHSSGEVWLSEPPMAKKEFLSGKMNVKPNGSVFFNGVQETYRGSYPDWENGAKDSFIRHMAAGYNMAFQMGADVGSAVANLVPEGMLIACDITGYVDSNHDKFGDLNGFRSSYGSFLATAGDDCRILYVDIEHGVWDAHDMMRAVKDIADEVADDAGVFRRPLFGVCGSPGGFESYRDSLDGMIPYGSNGTNLNRRETQAKIDGGFEGDCWSPLDIQQAVYTLVHSNELDLPLPFAVMNTSLNGTALDNAILNCIAYGVAAGHAHHRDVPAWDPNCGLHVWGYRDQDWWPNASAINRIVQDLKETMGKDFDVEFAAELPAAIDSGVEGVTRNFRIVSSNQVMAILVNNTIVTKSFDVTFPEDVLGATHVYAGGTTFSLDNPRTMSVEMPSLTATAIRLNTTIETGLALPPDVLLIEGSSHQTTATVTNAPDEDVSWTFTVSPDDSGVVVSIATSGTNNQTAVVNVSDRSVETTVVLTASITHEGQLYTDTQTISFAEDTSNGNPSITLPADVDGISGTSSQTQAQYENIGDADIVWSYAVAPTSRAGSVTYAESGTNNSVTMITLADSAEDTVVVATATVTVDGVDYSDSQTFSFGTEAASMSCTALTVSMANTDGETGSFDLGDMVSGEDGALTGTVGTTPSGVTVSITGSAVSVEVGDAEDGTYPITISVTDQAETVDCSFSLVLETEAVENSSSISSSDISQGLNAECEATVNLTISGSNIQSVSWSDEGGVIGSGMSLDMEFSAPGNAEVVALVTYVDGTQQSHEATVEVTKGECNDPYIVVSVQDGRLLVGERYKLDIETSKGVLDGSFETQSTDFSFVIDGDDVYLVPLVEGMMQAEFSMAGEDGMSYIYTLEFIAFIPGEVSSATITFSRRTC